METVIVIHQDGHTERGEIDDRLPIEAQLPDGWFRAIHDDLVITRKETKMNIIDKMQAKEDRRRRNFENLAKKSGRTAEQLDAEMAADTRDNRQDDPLGMNNTTPIVEPPAALKLAWERYDEAATRTDRLKQVRDNAEDAVVMAERIQDSADFDKEDLMGKCACPDDPESTIICNKCGAYARVIAWNNGRAK